MNEQELFELRKKHTRTFGRPQDLISFLDGLMIQEVKFPLVVGYERFDPDGNWKIHELTPQTTDDELTVRNYLSGLREFDQYLKKDEHAGLLFQNFSSILNYKGLDSYTRGDQNELVLGVQIGFTNSAKNRSLGSYSLHLYNEGPNYHAETEEGKTDMAKIMTSHMGPK